MEGQSEDGGTRWRWVVKATPWLALPSKKRPGTHITGGLVGPMAAMDRYGKSRPTLIRSLCLPARRVSILQCYIWICVSMCSFYLLAFFVGVKKKKFLDQRVTIFLRIVVIYSETRAKLIFHKILGPLPRRSIPQTKKEIHSAKIW